jgi:hypothetical protein
MSDKIVISQDGNKWCALQGSNMMEGLVGFGDSINEALRALLFGNLVKFDFNGTTFVGEVIDGEWDCYNHLLSKGYAIVDPDGDMLVENLSVVATKKSYDY